MVIMGVGLFPIKVNTNQYQPNPTINETYFLDPNINPEKKILNACTKVFMEIES